MKCPIILLVTIHSLSVGVALFEPQNLVVNLRVRLLVEEVHTKPLSHASDGGTKPMLAVAQCRCRVLLVMALPSLDGDSATKATLSVA
jgi:hypothetical protein